MKRIVAVGAGLLVGAVVLLLAAGPKGLSAVEAVGAGAGSVQTPEEVVTAFYDSYLGAIDLAEGHSPLAERSYRSSEFLSDDFVAEVDNLLDSFERGGYDPFLLAQDVPAEIEVGEAVISGGSVQVPVQTSFEGHALSVTLDQVDGAWKIVDIDPAPEMVVRSFYLQYLSSITGDGTARQNPLTDGTFREFSELSDEFVAEVAETIVSFDKGGADPILLAQDVPVELSVGDAVFAEGGASVTVEMFWGGNSEPSERVVTLERIEDRWQIVGVSFGG